MIRLNLSNGVNSSKIGLGKNLSEMLGEVNKKIESGALRSKLNA
jgi:hypothetical protein